MIKDGKPYSILIIEDNPGDFVIIEDYLMEEVYNPEIEQAKSFTQASAILSAAGAHFDVILLDLTLPDKGGKDLVTEILGIVPSCPVIILTGYTDIDFSIRSISQGVSDYLVKDDLNSAILYKSITYAIERKKATANLRESEKRYSDLFNLSPQAMWLFDPETFRFLQVNRAAIKLYGYSEDEFMRMTIMDIKLEEDIIETTQRIGKGKTDDASYKRTSTHRKKSGELIEVEIYATSITINNKSFRSVIAIDVTEKNLFETKIVKAIIKTQEDERYEIGGELHDNVCQLLAASQLNLGMLNKSLAPSGAIFFKDCKQNISSALDEIRNLSHRLAPAFFDDSTLEEAFKRLFGTFKIDEKLDLILHFDKAFNKYPISLELQLNLYRIAQEQLKNILKYASCTIIEIGMLIHKGRLSMRISDDGIGFDIEKAKGGIGLANMKRRAELFSGKFEIYSEPGNGCEIIVDIPLPKAK